MNKRNLLFTFYTLQNIRVKQRSQIFSLMIKIVHKGKQKNSVSAIWNYISCIMHEEKKNIFRTLILTDWLLSKLWRHIGKDASRRVCIGKKICKIEFRFILGRIYGEIGFRQIEQGWDNEKINKDKCFILAH